MAEKRLDVRVVASAQGVDQTAQKVDRLAQSVRNAAGARGGGSGGFLQGIKQQATAAGLAADSSMVGLIRGGGALAAASMLGQAMQRMPEAVREFKVQLATGTTKTEVFAQSLANSLPIVGEFAKG